MHGALEGVAQERADDAWTAKYDDLLGFHVRRSPADDADVDFLAHHLESELQTGDAANAAAFACYLAFKDPNDDVRTRVLQQLDAPVRDALNKLSLIHI